LELQTYITRPPEDSPDEYGLQYYEIAGDTDLLYSRLANKYAPIFKMDYLNCTTFVEIIVGSRINCGNLYSDPNNCINSVIGDISGNLDSEKIQKILDAYFDGDTTVEAFTKLVNYNPRNDFDMEV
jgi:hypothetical protein